MKKLKLEELGRVDNATFAIQQKVKLTVVLDNIRSAINVGSIFRTCDAFSVEKIILSGITACPPHKEINKSALGSTETVAWEYFADVETPLQQLQTEGYTIYAIEQTDSSILLNDFSFSNEKSIAIILGNEVDGVSDSALAFCKGAIEIPQTGTKHSLNVAVAGGIVIYNLSVRL